MGHRYLRPYCSARTLLTAAQASPVGLAVAVSKLDMVCLAVPVTSRLVIPVLVCAATRARAAKATVVETSFILTAMREP